MAKAPVYVVRSTLNSTVAYNASRAEYEHLIELGILLSLDEVITPPDDVIVSATTPASPAVGQVWFNTTIP